MIKAAAKGTLNLIVLVVLILVLVVPKLPYLLVLLLADLGGHDGALTVARDNFFWPVSDENIDRIIS